MKLPGAEEKENEEILNLIDKTREEGKWLEIEADGSISKRQKVYAGKLYDSDDREVFLIYVTESFSKYKFASAGILHDFMIEQYEAEVVPTDQIDEEHRDRLKSWEEKRDPLQEVHVVVKTTDDGRYKDDYKYAREGEDGEEKYICGLDQEDSRWKYIDLGTFKEVLKSDETYDFDLKQGSGRGIPIDFRALTSEEERQEVVDKISGDYSKKNGEGDASGN